MRAAGRFGRLPRGLRAAAALRTGVTLTEMMIATAVLSIGVISGMGSFKYINRAITQSRIKTISTNLVQEKMEVLRNKSYFQLLVTTAPATSTGFEENFTYDTGNYPPQTITLWGMPALTRVVNVAYVSAHGTDVEVLDSTANDPGMKKITVTVMWSDANGTPRKVQMSSYYENPTAAVLSAAVSGTVTNIAGGAPVRDALVQVMGSPNWRAYSDASGDYSFQVAPGSYTLVCSTRVYYSSTSVTVVASAGSTVDHDFSLTKVPVGRVYGYAYMRDHLVISSIVGSTDTASGDTEWVEVYNPTTWTWTMATGLGTGTEKVVFRYKETSVVEAALIFKYQTTTLAPGHYYLFANTTTVTAAGVTRAADAMWSWNGSWSDQDDTIKTGSPSNAGFVQLKDAVTGTVYDTVGWTAYAQAWPLYWPEAYEYFGVYWYIPSWMVNNNGLEPDMALTRFSGLYDIYPSSASCYESNHNYIDFYINKPIAYGPRNTSDAAVCVTGSVAAGAVVSATDGLSTSVKADEYGWFSLTGIATSTVQGSTNTWTINISSSASSYLFLGSSVGVTVPVGSRNIGDIVLSSTVEGGIAAGFVYGSGPDHNRPLGNPTIQVGAAGELANTDSQGFYSLFLPTGTIAIIANFASANGSYQTSYVEVDVEQGAVTNVPDFHLAQGGVISGYVTSGTGALPDIIVQATNGGPVYSSASDSTGHFYIYAATSSVAYEVTPVLDALQSYTSLPDTPLSVELEDPGSAVFSGTITVVGALGTIEGVLTQGGAVITTGVLVVASTATVSDPLPSVTAAAAPTQTVIYSVSSQADGTYSLDVRSSATETYNVRAFYPVVDPGTGAVSYTSLSASGISVSAGAITQQDFAW